MVSSSSLRANNGDADDRNDNALNHAEEVYRNCEGLRYPEQTQRANAFDRGNDSESMTATTSMGQTVEEDEIDDYAREKGASSTFFCPVSLELFKDPVVVRTGQTYERRSVEDWIKRGGKTCPATGQALTEANDNVVRVAPNFALRSAIQEWARRTCPEILNARGDVRGLKGHPIVGMTEMRLVTEIELRDIENAPSMMAPASAATINSSSNNITTSTSLQSHQQSQGFVRRMMSLTSAVPDFISNVNNTIENINTQIAQVQRNHHNNNNNNESNNNAMYWASQEIPPELPSSYRSIQTGPPIRRGESWFYPVQPSRHEAAFHEQNNFGFRNPQTHQNWIEIRRDGDAVETAVAYRVSLRLLPVMRNQQSVRWVFLFSILVSMMYGIQLVFCNNASFSSDGNTFIGPSKLEFAKSSCIAGNLGWLVTEKLEIWRLFTSVFATGNVVTLAFTLLSLLLLAAPIERNIGGYIAIPLFFGPFNGIIASTFFLNDHVTTGAMASIASCIPLAAADLWKTKELSFLHVYAFACVLIVTILGYSPFTDNLTNLFAFLFGLAITGVYYSPERPSMTSRQVKSAQTGYAIFLAFIFFTPFLLLCVGDAMGSGSPNATSTTNGFTCMPGKLYGDCSQDVLTWKEYYEIPDAAETRPFAPNPPTFPPPPPPSPPPPPR